jgi:hypothetical protein
MERQLITIHVRPVIQGDQPKVNGEFHVNVLDLAIERAFTFGRLKHLDMWCPATLCTDVAAL